MARTLGIILIAAIVGGGAVYAAMLYLDGNPVDVAVSVRSATPTPAAAPTMTPTPEPLPTDTPLPTATPHPTNTLAAPTTSTLAPTATRAPTPTSTAIPPTEREIVVNAFAECDGQYSGRDKDHRIWAADSAIEEGRQTVADVRALVERYCGGVFPELMATAAVPAMATPQSPPPGALATTFTPTPAPTQTLVPTAAPRPALAAAPDLRYIEEKRYMLSLINAERKKAGVGAVVLGDNIAAQIHAESALDNCFSSHWGVDGLKPYMRYSLAGGYQSNGENGSGLNYCIKASDGYRANGPIEQEIREAMDSLMNSPGHRRQILYPTHKMVNVGLAWDRYNTKVFQHFEGDYVAYDRLPSIEDGVLFFSGKTRNGGRFNADTGQQIYYDPPPHPLTRGQVARTYCSDGGRLVASLRKPLTGGWYYNTHEFSTTYEPCPNPYDVPASAAPARSPSDAHRLWQEAYDASQSRTAQPITVPWITASEWTANGTTFTVKADISSILNRRGAGVYTLALWGKVDGESVVISEYSIFYDVTPPSGYRSGS